MNLPKAFPDKNKFQNLNPFRKDTLNYMREALEQHGSPVDLNVPVGNYVLINDAEQIGTVFKNEKEYYRKSKGYKQIELVLGNGLLTAEGEEWQEQRRTLQPSFHKNELRKLLPSIWETGNAYINGLGDKATLSLDTEMSGLTMSVLLNSLIKYQDDEMASKMSENIQFGQEFIIDRVRSPFKWPVWFPTRTNKKYHEMRKEADEIIQVAVNDRKVMTERVEDLLGVLMEFYDPDKEFAEIRNQMLTFLVAGHETSAIAMTWTLHVLAHEKEIQNQLYEEIKDINSLEDMDLMNYSGLDYTSQVIKESLRHYPPIWNIVRRAIKKNEVGGYEIDVDKQLMLNIYFLHHNPKYWENPDVFDPERFKPGSQENRHKFQYLPFGGGGRFCIGNNFALYEIMLLLVQFVKNFEIKPKCPRDIPFNPLLTLRSKDPVEVELVKRSN